MFDLIEEGVSKREYLGLGESYKIRVWGGVGSRDMGGGEWRLCRRGSMWLEGVRGLLTSILGQGTACTQERPGRAWEV